jgi:hypothetical protein
MLFDIEDYRTSGLIDAGRYSIPERTFVNKVGAYPGGNTNDPQTTALYTRIAHINSFADFFNSSLAILPLDKKQNALNKYYVWLEKCRNFNIASKPFWNMINSLPVLFVEGGRVFEAGDEFIVEEKQIDDLPNQAKYLFNQKGLMYPWSNPNDPNYGYNSEALSYVSGFKYQHIVTYTPVKTVSNEHPWVNSNTYTPFSQEIVDSYYESVELLMESEKEVMIAIEGYQTNFTSVEG